MRSFSFGSISGSTFAFYFFLLLALFVGFAIYRILLEPRFARIWGSSVSRPAALAMGAGATLMVLLGVYFGALDGFYGLDVAVDGQEIRLDYILPRRSLTLKTNEIAEVRRVPAYKGRWQLILYTPNGAQFASSRADYASTRAAWEYLSTQVKSQPKPE